MEDKASVWKIFGNSQARRKVVPVGVHQPSRVPQLAADENGRNAIVENKVRIGVLLVVEGACVVVGVTCQLSSANAAVPHARKSICGMPAWRCFTAGRLSSRLARPEPLPSLKPNSVV